MSNFVIALFVALGASTWVYAKMMKTSGGLTKNALVVAGVCGVLVLLILSTILNMVIPS